MSLFKLNPAILRSHSNRSQRANALCALLLVGAISLSACSSDGEGVPGFGAEGKGKLVDTELGKGYVDGPTTTIVAPPGVDVDADQDINERENKTDSEPAASSTSQNEESSHAGGNSLQSGLRKFLGLGGSRNSDKPAPIPELSHIDKSSVRELCNGPDCETTSMDIEHPSWGSTRLFAMLPPMMAGRPPSTIGAVDVTGTIRWSFTLLVEMDTFRILPVRDENSNAVYIEYGFNGDYGILCLFPTQDGFFDLPNKGNIQNESGNGTVMFPHTKLGDVDSTGNHTLIQQNADGEDKTLMWSGSGFK